jgi:hypothetical protein
VTVRGADWVPTICGVAKVTGVGLNVTGGSTAEPVSVTTFGLPAAFDAMLNEAFFVPVDVGLNVRLTTHDGPPGAIGAVQLFVRVNEAASRPVNVGVTVRSANPVLLTVTVLTADVPFTAVIGRLNVAAGVVVRAGASETIVRATLHVPLTVPGVWQKLSCSKLRRVSMPSGRTARLSVTRTDPKFPTPAPATAAMV